MNARQLHLQQDPVEPRVAACGGIHQDKRDVWTFCVAQKPEIYADINHFVCCAKYVQVFAVEMQARSLRCHHANGTHFRNLHLIAPRHEIDRGDNRRGKC